MVSDLSSCSSSKRVFCSYTEAGSIRFSLVSQCDAVGGVYVDKEDDRKQNVEMLGHIQVDKKGQKISVGVIEIWARFAIGRLDEVRLSIGR